MNSLNFIRYIGGKARMAKKIMPFLHATGAECLVDIFGGSAAVTLNSRFQKRVYNDLDGDLVNLFRVMGKSKLRRELLYILRYMPASRQIYMEDGAMYRKGGLSFREIIDPVDRARATFYRHAYAFGGKVRNGGFQATFSDRRHVKETYAYRRTLKRFAEFGKLFSETVIEHLDYQDIIRSYGKRKSVVLFADPPYPELSNGYYYSIPFSKSDHVFLAHMLAETPAPAVCTFYDIPFIRENYSETVWDYHETISVKNSQAKGPIKAKVVELILVKKTRVQTKKEER